MLKYRHLLRSNTAGDFTLWNENCIPPVGPDLIQGKPMLPMLSICFATVPSQILLQAERAVTSEPFLLCVFGFLLVLTGGFMRRHGLNSQLHSGNGSPAEPLPRIAQETSPPSASSTQLGGRESSSLSTFAGFWVPQASNSEAAQNTPKL